MQKNNMVNHKNVQLTAIQKANAGHLKNSLGKNTPGMTTTPMLQIPGTRLPLPRMPRLGCLERLWNSLEETHHRA